MKAEQPQTELKRKTIYRPTNFPGVRSVWDFSEKRNDYVMRKSGNRFMATVEKNGRTTSQSFGSIQDAAKWRDRMKLDLERLPTFEVYNFNEIFKKFLNNRRSKVRLTTYEAYINLSKHFSWLNDQQIEDINSQTIDQWLSQVKSPDYLSKFRSTRESFGHELSLLRLIFSYYTEYYNENYVNPVRKRHFSDSVIDHNRIQIKKELAKQKYISPTDIEKCLEVFKSLAETTPYKKMFYVAFLIQLRTGLRIGEVGALKYEDINWQTGLVQITKTVQWMRTKNRKSVIGDVPKNGCFRTVVFITELLKALKELQITQGRIGGLIFSEDGMTLLPYRSFQFHYNNALLKAKVGHSSTHILRHSFATHFLEVTKDPIALKGILGHSDLRMTEKYAKITEKTTSDGMNAFNQALIQLKPENT